MTSERAPEPSTGSPVCYRHPDRPTRLSCSDCGRPICPSCSIDAAVGQKCPPCLNQGGRQQVVDVGRRFRRPSTGAPVTMTLIAASVSVWMLSFFAPGLADQLFGLFAQANQLIAAGQWWRIFTVVLVHAGLAHILFNMWALYVLGPQVERAVGSGAFLALYLAAAGVGGVLAYHLGGPADVGVGASGGIFGLFGVWLNWAVRRRDTAYGRYLLGQLGFLLLINAALPLMFPGISWQAHLGGLIAGFAIGEGWSHARGPSASTRRVLMAAAVAGLAVVAVLV